MTTLREDDLAFAAAPAPAQLRLLATAAPPRAPVEQGKGSGGLDALSLASLLAAPAIAPEAGTTPLDELAMQIEQRARFTRLFEGTLDPELASVARWEGDENVFALSSLRASVRIEGAAKTVEEEDEPAPSAQPPAPLGMSWYLDARSGPVRVHLLSDSGEYLLRFEAGTASLWIIERADDPRLEPLRAFRPRENLPWGDPSALAIPGPDELLGPSQGWLLEQSRALHGSTWLLDRVASLGLIYRLYQPADARAEIERRLRGEEPPHRRQVEAWAGQLGQPASKELERAALGRIERLQEQFEAVMEEQDQADEGSLRSLLLDRDNLESIAEVLRLAGVGQGLAQALAEFDQQAELHLSSLEGLSLHDERLAAVAWQQPMAWWGVAAQPGP